MKKQSHSLQEDGRHFRSSVSLSDELELLVHLNRGARPSLQRQLLKQLRQAIQQGSLAPGRRLPATRPLAFALGISRNIVEAVYDELSIEGHVVRRRGSGTYVNRELLLAPRAPQPIRSEAPRWLRQVSTAANSALPVTTDTIVFAPGVPDVSLLPLSAWRTIWRTVGARLPPTAYGAPAGDPELRAALAGYLRRVRGFVCAPDDIVITTGASQAFDLLAQAALLDGDVIGFEEPGYPIARHIFQARGARILPLPVDEGGLRIDTLPVGRDAPKLIYLTPSHQYPLGGRLSIARRMALLNWASAQDSLLIEDDYDSEFRFGAAPLPAMTSLEYDGRVVYVGTFSKVLTPALRVGYLVTPQLALRERILRLKALHDFHAAWPSQRALLTFITEDHLERHIRRMRRRYGEKRALLNTILAPLAQLAHVSGLDAGLHMVLEMHACLDARDIAQRTQARGVVTVPLDQFYHAVPDRQGLVLGYGGVALSQIVQGASILCEVIMERACQS